jgi:hypothetical protein
VPGSSSQGIFLSYRREDAAPYAVLLEHELRERLPDARVFMDLDSIEGGMPFAEVIRDAVESCAVLVALIGRQWVTLADAEGNRRLDKPGDFVRFEVQAALERGVRVIPVLVDGASPPSEQQLPSELRKLAGLNALKLSYERYQTDADRLFDLIQRVLAPTREPEEAKRSAQEEADRKARKAEKRKARKAEQRKAQPGAESTARAATARDLHNVLQARERILGAEHPDILGIPGPFYSFQQLDATMTRMTYERLLPREERVLGPEHPDILVIRANLAGWTGRSARPGDAATARDQYAAVLPLYERILGPEHPDTLTTRRNLAFWTGTGQAGDAATARDQFAAVLPLYERILGPEHPDTLTTRRELADLTGTAGDPAGARDQLAALLPVYERVLGPGGPISIRASLDVWTKEARKRRRWW